MSAYGRQLVMLPDPIDVEFAEHRAAHPEVYDALVRLARQWKAAGHPKGGIGMLWELLRWEYGLAGPETGPRLNNNLRSRYARLVMWTEPDLAGFFDTRQLRVDVGEVA